MLKTELFTGHHRDGKRTYSIEVRAVRPHQWLAAKAYCWYDLRIPCKIPGWRRFEKWLARHGAEHSHGFEGDREPKRWRDRLYGWTVEQDFRCYDLSHRTGTVVARAEITEEAYVAAGGKFTAA